MAYPTTDWPGATDATIVRVDLVDIIWASEFNYRDGQIREIQDWLGDGQGELIGDNGNATDGAGGVVSPVATGGTAFKVAARDAYVGGKILSIGDNFDVAYVEKVFVEADGSLTATDEVQSLSTAEAILSTRDSAALATPAAIGVVQYKAENTTPATAVFAEIEVTVDDDTAGAEGSYIDFNLRDANNPGSLSTLFQIYHQYFTFQSYDLMETTFKYAGVPSSSDIVKLFFDGPSSTSVNRTYATLTVDVLDNTNTTEDGSLEVSTIFAGSDTRCATFRDGQVLLENGSLSAPALSFSSDQDSGIITDGSGVTSFVAGSYDVFRVDGAGKTTFCFDDGAAPSYAIVEFSNLDTTPLLNDYIMLNPFTGYDGAGVPAQYFYGMMYCQMTNITDGSESGSVVFSVADGGSQADPTSAYRTFTINPGKIEIYGYLATPAPTEILIERGDTPVAAYDVGYVTFEGRDDAGNDQDYTRIVSYATGVTHASESGSLQFYTAISGTLTLRADIGAAANLDLWTEDGTSTQYNYRTGTTNNGDSVFVERYYGTDDAGTPQTELYAQLQVVAVDVTAANPDGRIEILTDVAGIITEQMSIGPGLAVGPTATVLPPGAGAVNVSGHYEVDDVQVVTNRQTGWAAATGTADRTTFVTGSVTLSELAERVKALIDDLITHGLIGA